MIPLRADLLPLPPKADWQARKKREAAIAAHVTREVNAVLADVGLEARVVLYPREAA